jgi:hypothetical protein
MCCLLRIALGKGDDAHASDDGGVEVPDPPPALAAEGELLRKKPRFSNPSWEVPGYGWIVHDVGRSSLDAHCGLEGHKCPRNPCRLNRGVTRAPGCRNPHKGRPLGLLIAWLFAVRPDRETHGHVCIARHQTPEDVESISLARRQAARQWAKDHGLGHLEALERPKDDLEADEPEGFA